MSLGADPRALGSRPLVNSLANGFSPVTHPQKEEEQAWHDAGTAIICSPHGLSLADAMAPRMPEEVLLCFLQRTLGSPGAGLTGQTQTQTPRPAPRGTVSGGFAVASG